MKFFRMNKIGRPSVRSRDEGFTLLELLLSILIIAVVASVLIQQRLEIVREASIIRSHRIAWELASRQMSILELDPNTFKEDTSGSERFEDYPEYGYDYTVAKEELPTNDPDDPNQKPKEIMKLSLTIKIPEARSEEDNVTLISYHPIYEEQQTHQQPPQGQ